MNSVGEVVRNREPFRISEDMTVLQAARYMTGRKVGAVCVVSGERLAGIVSERDIMSKVITRELNPQTTRVSEIMTREVVIAEANEDLEACLERMRQRDIRHLPVVENQKLLGMVTMRDLLVQKVDEKDFEVKMMTTYIYSHPAE